MPPIEIISPDDKGRAPAAIHYRPESLLRLAAVMARTGLGRSKLYAMIAAGTFVAPTHIRGTRISVWPSSAVDRWIAAQLEGDN